MSKSNVTLDLSHGGLGDLVTESVRAYLYTGNPSALMQRVLAGITLYRQETEGTHSREQHLFLAYLRHHILLTCEQLQEVEGTMYASQTPMVPFKDTE